MSTLKTRLASLEQRKRSGWGAMEVNECPTPDQQAKIDAAIASGSFLVVFVAKGNTAWVAGHGPPPWERRNRTT